MRLFHSLRHLFNFHIFRRCLNTYLCIASTLLLVACKAERSPAPLPKPVEATTSIPQHISEAEAETKGKAFWVLAQNTLSNTIKEGQQLQTHIENLLNSPSSDSLKSTQEQWQRTYRSYQALEPFLLIESQVEQQLFQWLSDWRFKLAAWPMQPGYLDSFDVYAQSGLVNDITIPITATNLRKQHGLTDVEDVTLGLHAMEFLLWGQNAKRTAKAFEFQSKVPLALAQAGLKTSELPNNRRRLILQFQSQLLLKDLRALAKVMSIEGVITASFEQLPAQEKIATINRGLKNYLNQVNDKWSQQQEQNDEYLALGVFNNEHAQLHDSGLSSVYDIYFTHELDLAASVFSTNVREEVKTLLNELQSTPSRSQLNQLTHLISISLTTDESPNG